MPAGTSDDPILIDPGKRFAWAVLNPFCNAKCEQDSLIKDVTPEILALEPGQCFVFHTNQTVLFERINHQGHPCFTLHPFDPNHPDLDHIYALEEPQPDDQPGIIERIRKTIRENFSPFEDMKKFENP